MRLSARADRGITEQTNGSGALSRCMSEEICQYNKFCACLITPPVRASGSISISTPSGPFALPTLKVDRMDTIASHIYVSKVILTIQLTGHNMRQCTSVSAKARPGQILNHVNVLYESRRERYIPASETKGIVHCIIIQGAVSFYKSFWQERVCILIDFFISRHCPKDIIRPIISSSREMRYLPNVRHHHCTCTIRWQSCHSVQD